MCFGEKPACINRHTSLLQAHQLLHQGTAYFSIFGCLICIYYLLCDDGLWKGLYLGSFYNIDFPFEDLLLLEMSHFSLFLTLVKPSFWWVAHTEVAKKDCYVSAALMYKSSCSLNYTQSSRLRKQQHWQNSSQFQSSLQNVLIYYSEKMQTICQEKEYISICQSVLFTSCRLPWVWTCSSARWKGCASLCICM